MRIEKESDLLNEAKRKSIIDAIESTENKARKQQAYKAYQCYKDNTKEYVYRQLNALFTDETVKRMQYAITNIAFVRKIVDKLARVYKYGVDREVLDDQKTTEAIHVATKQSDVDACFKKTNRIMKLSKNCLQYIIPKKNNFKNDEIYDIKCIVLPPYLYDVVEQYDDRTKPGCIILSDYSPESETLSISTNPGLRIQSLDKDGNAQINYADGIDSPVADVRDSKNYSEEKKKYYVFWSDSYHFMTDEKGIIINKDPDVPEDIGNPIGKMPFVNYAEDQDNSFWAQGGTDLIDGGVSLNTMLTNINHIAITQGYGQLVISGQDLPQTILTGPDRVILLPHDGEGAAPSVDYKSANPPLNELQGLISSYVALLLTTNNLSTTGVRTQLDGAQAFASGLAMMIDRAESMEDVEDQRQIFIDNEPKFWEIYSLWHKEFKEKLSPELKKITFADSFLDKFSIKYGEPKVIQTDKDRLDVLKQKLELGLLSKLDALKTEYPNMKDSELQAKLEEIIQEKIKAIRENPITKQVQENNQNDEMNQDGGDNQGNDNQQGNQ